ncbi:MAG: site-2 protease family protein, partial [Patescibacteria group bacterium]
AAAIGLLNIFISLYLLLKHMILGQGLVFDVAGPVGIAVMIGESARMGFQYLLNMTAMISLSLAAVNILPIPALDGGRVFFLGVEKLIGRPVALKYEQTAHTVGFVLLMILVVLVTGRDVLRLL